MTKHFLCGHRSKCHRSGDWSPAPLQKAVSGISLSYSFPLTCHAYRFWRRESRMLEAPTRYSFFKAKNRRGGDTPTIEANSTRKHASARPSPEGLFRRSYYGPRHRVARFRLSARQCMTHRNMLKGPTSADTTGNGPATPSYPPVTPDGHCG